jgi:hypothetical protein
MGRCGLRRERVKTVPRVVLPIARAKPCSICPLAPDWRRRLPAPCDAPGQSLFSLAASGSAAGPSVNTSFAFFGAFSLGGGTISMPLLLILMNKGRAGRP